VRRRWGLTDGWSPFDFVRIFRRGAYLISLGFLSAAAVAVELLLLFSAERKSTCLPSSWLFFPLSPSPQPAACERERASCSGRLPHWRRQSGNRQIIIHTARHGKTFTAALATVYSRQRRTWADVFILKCCNMKRKRGPKLTQPGQTSLNEYFTLVLFDFYICYVHLMALRKTKRKFTKAALYSTCDSSFVE